jgi:hypothetical protein
MTNLVDEHVGHSGEVLLTTLDVGQSWRLAGGRKPKDSGKKGEHCPCLVVRRQGGARAVTFGLTGLVTSPGTT